MFDSSNPLLNCCSEAVVQALSVVRGQPGMLSGAVLVTGPLVRSVAGTLLVHLVKP